MKQTINQYSKKRLPHHDGYYLKSGIFAQYVPKRLYNGYSDKHWKLHVNYSITSHDSIKEEYLNQILGFLRHHDLDHKIVLKEKDIFYRMNRPSKDNTQNGKIITVYCNSEEECKWTLMKLDEIMIKKGYKNLPLRAEDKFRNDKIFNHNLFLGYRYASTPRKPYYVIPEDKNHNEIPDLQKIK